jgi:hypothetical protein
MKVTATLLATAFLNFVAFFSIAAQGQTYIFGRADFPASGYPVAIAAGDFNGDGVSDIVVANNGDNIVSILLGRPDGTFGPPNAYPSGSEPVAVATGDFNGDGNLDVAVTNGNCKHGNLGPSCSASTVSILLGNGDGTFQPHSDYPVGALPSALAVTDLNGDGKLDLAVANAFDLTVSILLGNGDGTFKPQVVYSTTTGSFMWESVVVGDFNGDGKPDLAVTCGSVVSVFLGKGDGTFGSHIDSGVGGIGGGISLAAGDFNRDGKLDLAVSGVYSNFVPSFVSVLLGNGDGTFVLQGQYTGGSLVATADLNGDGKLDLVLSGAAGANGNTYDSVAVLLGNGDGTFQPEVHYGTANTPFGFAVIDLNGDGKLDLAVANSGCVIVANPCIRQQAPPGTISVLLGFGDGTFVGRTDYPTGAVSPMAITSADFNKDGKLDLAAANRGSDSVSVLLGNGDGTFQSEVSYPMGQYPGSLAFGDFRNNGDVDLVSANQVCITPPCNPGTVSVLLGNGDGTFQPHVDYGAGLMPGSVAVGDFRGNGKLDLAASNAGSSSVSILLGNGDGTFRSQVSYLAGSAGQIAIGDFNQDGKLDLAAGVSILLGNGDGTFKSPTSNAAGGSAIATADFNGDGKLDLAAGGGNFQISILLGNGDGTFQAPINYPTGVLADADSIVVADFNMDGKLDLAVNTNSSEALIFLGNGDGTFQQPIEYLLANFLSYGLTVVDFNGDGVPDWAAPDAGGDTVGVMLSTAFKAVSPSSLNFGSQGVSTTSAPQIITVSNPSNVKIDIGSIAATGSFSQTNTCPAALTPRTNCAVNVTFSPTATGLQAGSINLTDSTRISPLAVSLNGTGVNGPFLTAYPSRKNFAPQTVGTTSSTAAVVLVNTGNASLNLSGVSITGTNSSDFTQSNNCGGSLLPAGSCTVSATFVPTAGGSRIASLAVSDTAPGSPQMISLSGMAIAAPDFAIALASGSNSLTISAGHSAMFQLAITPSGVFTGTVSLSCAITPVVSPAPTCGLSASSVQLGGSSSPSVTVTVATTASATTGAPFNTALPPGAVFSILTFSGLAVMLVRGRRRLPALATPVLAIGLALCLSCGGGSSQHTTTGTPSGKYAAIVAATSGSLSHSMALTVVVQ